MDYKNYLRALNDENEVCAARVRRFNNVGGSSIDAYSYIIATLKILYRNITYKEICQSITDSEFDEQIDAIIIKDGFIDIYDFKVSEGFGVNEIRLFRDSVNKHLFLANGDLDNCSELLKRRILLARHFLNNKDYKVRLRIIRGGNNSLYPQGEVALQEIQYDSIIEKSLISLKDLMNIELSLEKIPLEYDLRISAAKNSPHDTSSQIIINDGSNISSLICRVPLKELVDFYHDFQPSPERIFQSNVRGLQNGKKISTEIINSLTSAVKAKEFYKLHNGITIVCDRITSISNDKYKIHNPQIVNGCQTITTISKHFENSRTSSILKYGNVITKIFATDIKQLEKICFASNSQVAINPWDLRTNDKIQIVIESFLNKKGISYNRKGTKINSKNRLLFKELGQFLCATLLQKPAAAKNARATIFSNGTESMYNQIFNEEINLNDVYEIISISLFVKEKIKQSTVTEKKYLVPANLHIIAGIYFMKDEVSNKDDLYKQTVKFIDSVIREVKRKHGHTLNPPAIFTKYELSWELLKKKLIKFYK